MTQEIVHIALENLHQITGIEGYWKDLDPLDGELVLTVNDQKITFVVEIKQEVRTHQLRQIEHNFHHHTNFILVANRLFPKIKDELRLQNIPYLEVNGNAFIKREELFLLVDTQKTVHTEKNKGNRAFTKTGLKVLFYLLQHKEAINLTQRELAKKADVALGNIPKVIQGLRDTGYLLPLNDKTYVWENREELLERWIAEYATVLRPKLTKQKYTYRGNWKDIKLNTEKTLWGGEAAADIITNHLRPEKFVVYTHENRMDLITNYQLIPDKNGEIEVLEKFWKQDKGTTAPPILVYADLQLEGGKRNKETADIIYHDYIKPNL